MAAVAVAARIGKPMWDMLGAAPGAAPVAQLVRALQGVSYGMHELQLLCLAQHASHPMQRTDAVPLAPRPPPLAAPTGRACPGTPHACWTPPRAWPPQAAWRPCPLMMTRSSLMHSAELSRADCLSPDWLCWLGWWSSTGGATALLWCVCHSLGSCLLRPVASFASNGIPMWHGSSKAH